MKKRYNRFCLRPENFRPRRYNVSPKFTKLETLARKYFYDELFYAYKAARILLLRVYIFATKYTAKRAKRRLAVQIARIFYIILRGTILFFFSPPKKNTRKFFNNHIALVRLSAARTRARDLVIKLRNTVSGLNHRER